MCGWGGVGKGGAGGMGDNPDKRKGVLETYFNNGGSNQIANPPCMIRLLVLVNIMFNDNYISRDLH